MATGGSANFSAGSLVTSSNLTVELINRLISAQLGEVNKKIDGIELKIVSETNIVEDYKLQEVDPNVKCETTLEVIKSLPEFTGEPTQYVGWREAAETVMSLYKIKSQQYFIALTILRNKIRGAAHDALTNHGTVLNFQAILSRLDFIYSDKRPIHVLESELSILRQGRMTVTEFYNEVNKKMTLLINKTIMTYGKDNVITKETNKTIRSNALRIFISGLNGSISETLFSLNPPDLPNALAKVQELESNNFRAQFAHRYYGFKNENKNQGNNLRFNPVNSIQNNNTKGVGNNWNHNQNNNWPQNRNFWQTKKQNTNPKQQTIEPMEVDPSFQIQNRPRNNWQTNNNQGRYNNNYYQNNNRQNYYRPNQTREQTQAQKREPEVSSNQPANKVTRLNNINEDHFLDQTPTEECLM